MSSLCACSHISTSTRSCNWVEGYGIGGKDVYLYYTPELGGAWDGCVDSVGKGDII